MARIVGELIKKLQGSSPKKVKNKNKFFDKVAEHNVKTYNRNEDPVIPEEWIKKREKIFDVMEVYDNKHMTVGVFYLTR